jgi:molybdopterin synthase catalytic subunit
MLFAWLVLLLGVVGIGEASVVIAVSSPHRRESLEVSADTSTALFRAAVGNDQREQSVHPSACAISVVFAVQSVAWCIDELKRVLCVWKKEHYADGSVWKQNAEFDASALAVPQPSAGTVVLAAQ